MHDGAGVSPASDYSVALLSAFVRLGVRDVVLSPGSRSQALALVAAELERVEAVRLTVRIDERVAGFVALGLALETRMPALVATTSGTATANLHPAVLEAHHSGVPMILLTADRPAELRGIRSNQTTTQPGMYGEAVRLLEDVAAPEGSPDETDAAVALATRALHAALGTSSRTPGPVQLNLAFREPLSAVVPDLSGVVALASAARGPESARPIAHAPSDTGAPVSLDGATIAGGAAIAGRLDESVAAPHEAVAVSSAAVAVRPTLALPLGPRTVVIAGHDAGPAAEELAHAGGWPLIAEVSSGARFGRNLVVAYRELLAAEDFGGRVQRAIVFGHPTLSREVPALLSRDDVEVVVAAPTGLDVYNPGRRAAHIVSDVRVDPGSPALPDARVWLGGWVTASRRLAEQASVGPDQTPPDVDASRSHTPADRIAFARAEFAAVRAPVTRRMLVEALWRFTWPYDRLVFGASRLIREADRAVPGKNIRVHANRGLAGIDGTISTSIGVALASQGASDARAGAGVTRVLLGDLTLLHDVGALLFGVGESRPHIQVVVGNDGGGTIFDALEVAYSAPSASFERVMLTPQRADLAALASAYGWHYARATTRGELDQALSAPPPGPSILEIPLPR